MGTMLLGESFSDRLTISVTALFSKMESRSDTQSSLRGVFLESALDKPLLQSPSLQPRFSGLVFPESVVPMINRKHGCKVEWLELLLATNS